MARWTCPGCEREFARTGQSHTCVPAGTVDETFAGRPAYQRAAYDAIIAHLESLGPVHVDAVGVGVFLKSDRKFAEIRPMARALSVNICIGADRIWSVIRVQGPDDVDGDLLAALTSAYDDATSGV